MEKRKEIVAVIPVKGNSDRVKEKNLRDFSDTNIFELKLAQLKLADCFSDLIVSSEDEKILSIACNAGYRVHERDAKYSTSSVPMSQVYSYIGSQVSGDHIAWINVTNPLAGAEFYSQAVSEYRKMAANYDCLLSVYELHDYIFYDRKPLNFPRSPWPRSQDLQPVLAMSFVINILRREDLIRWGSLVGQSPFLFVWNQIDSWDIDFQNDFDICEIIHRERRNRIAEES